MATFWVFDWSHNGRYLLGGGQSTKESDSDIWIYDFEDKSARPWLPTGFNEISARFSPNDTWIAYASDKSGSYEIYVRPFDGTMEPIKVSEGGGLHPVWSAESQELFYLRPNGTLMVVDISELFTKSRIGITKELFTIALNGIANEDFSPYDVSTDG